MNEVPMTRFGPERVADDDDDDLGRLLEVVVFAHAAHAVPTLALPPGLHAGFIDSRDARDDSLTVTLLDGRSTRAVVASHVDAILVGECLAQRRMVLLSSGVPPVVVGAIQTSPAPFVDRDGTFAIDAQRIRLRANQELRLEAGANAVTIEIDSEGKMKLRCERGVFDVAANLRIHSALVELP